MLMQKLYFSREKVQNAPSLKDFLTEIRYPMNIDTEIKRGAFPATSLLTPDNCAIIIIDHQQQMALGLASIDRHLLLNNIVALAKTGKAFNVPTILTTVAARSFSGPIFSQLQDVFPDQTPIDRTTVNSWEDENLVAAVEETGRRRLVMSGLWTTICLSYPALSAIEAGYEVYVVADTCGDVDEKSHQRGLERVMQAGAIPVTWLQVLCEFQRDWARQETYHQTLEIVKQHGGAYGLGVEYAEAMVEGFAHSGAA
jgi:nicotinamidase-related amidase